MKLRPIADSVVLKETKAEETTASGIILSTSSKEKSAVCEVVAVGEGKKDVTMSVKPGDKVIVADYTGKKVKLDGEEFTIVKMGDILTVVE